MRSKTSDQRFDARFAAVSCALCILLFVFVNGLKLEQHTRSIEYGMQFGLIVMLGSAVWAMARPVRGTPEQEAGRRHALLVLLILSAGALMRIGYMLYTPITLRAHDLGKVSLSDSGHAGYILTLMQGHLPASNYLQFYHPPLFHFLAALASSAWRAVSGFTQPEQYLEAAKLVSCCASLLTLVYAKKLCRALRLGQRAELCVLLLAAFLPNHYLLAGRVNNDGLAVLFMTAILYYTLCWYRTQTWGLAVRLALCFGLGMMTKISVGALAPVTGAVMAVTLVRAAKKKQFMPLLEKLIVFALIAAPLALWYPYRNLILFNQPLNYVMRLEPDNPLYCGQYTLWQRFGAVWHDQVWDMPFEDYNVWAYLVRGSLFGEFQFNIGTALPRAFALLNAVLVAASAVGLVPALRRPSAHKPELWILAAFWFTQLASYLAFNVSYPFGCTMDFRYVVPTALTGAVFLGEGWCGEVQPAGPGRARAAGRAGNAVLALCLLFAAFSVVAYCNV